VTVVAEGLTPGLTRALAKSKHLTPCECGFPMPVYPGRYPSKCPLCGAPRRAQDMLDAPEEEPDGDSETAPE
jgi:hypothetical protein